MKYIYLFALFLMSSCGQSQTNVLKDNIKPETKDTITSQVPNSMVRHVRQARNGDILIASYTGVFRYDGKSFTNITTSIKSPSFWDVLEDRKGNLWFATKDSGVYHYNGKSFQHFTIREGLANNRVGSIYEDKAGNIWFATGGGASRYDGKSFQNLTTKEGLSNNDLTTIMEDKTGKLWFGTRGDACFYDGKTFTVFKNKDGKPFYNVWSIIEDKKGSIWFGDVDGLWRYDGSTFTKVSQRGAYAIIEDKKGNIWTTGEVNSNVWALSRYDAKSLYDASPTVTEIKSGGPAFLGILEANDGSIWFGSFGAHSAVYRYDGKTITDFKNKEGQQSVIIDTKESVVTWKGSMLMGSNSHEGYVYASKGELMINSGQVVGGTVEVDMNTIGEKTHGSNNELVKHFKSPDFFDVEKFPFSTIVITRVASINDVDKEITGNLTIKGITHPVTFPAKMEVKDSIVKANGKLVIDRTKWDVRYESGKFYDVFADKTISDSIEFNIKIVAKNRN